MDIVLHPRFAENKLIYLTYSKPDDKNQIRTALARGRWDGAALTDVQDIFVAQPSWNGTEAPDRASHSAGRPAVHDDRRLGCEPDGRPGAGQSQGEGAATARRWPLPPDNPFVGKAGEKPEIFSLGHRNQLGLAIRPRTGAVWSNENGPNGGDEINMILAGRNYGWPLVSLGRDYAGPWQGKFAADGSRTPSCTGRPRLPFRGWRSTRAIGFRHGRATCSSARCGWVRSPARVTCSGSCSTTRTRSCDAR